MKNDLLMILDEFPNPLYHLPMGIVEIIRMVRPESCIGSAGGSPDRVSTGAPGSRHRYEEE
ncbi:MAG: hypothetical protein M1508_14800, partial [Nitrospirae bacterium]|nr:hypothetical protein [Nitrospirota bacterium]